MLLANACHRSESVISFAILLPIRQEGGCRRSETRVRRLVRPHHCSGGVSWVEEIDGLWTRCRERVRDSTIDNHFLCLPCNPWITFIFSGRAAEREFVMALTCYYLPLPVCSLKPLNGICCSLACKQTIDLFTSNCFSHYVTYMHSCCCWLLF